MSKQDTEELGRELTQDDVRNGFIRAVCSYSGARERWTERSSTGLTDEELKEALAYELGTAGGSGAKGALHVNYQGAGLKIWIAWEIVNPYSMPPTLQGSGTMRMAREVFAIADPNNDQLALF